MRTSLAPLCLFVAIAAGAPVPAIAQQGAPAPTAAAAAQPITPEERQQGAAANKDIINEYGGAYQGPQVPYVERIGRRIALQSGLSADPGAFTVTVLDSPIENAFAIPGGYIYVTRGLLALMNDEAELAGVLGHEVGHVAARHSRSRQRVAQRNAILGMLGQVLVGAATNNSGLGQLLGQGLNTGSQLLTLGYSRGQETEADNLGIRYLNSARYDTDALSSMLADLAASTRLSQQLSGQTRSVPAWASTHPDPDKRVRAALTQAQATGGTDFPRNRDAYLNAINGMIYGDNPEQGVVDGQNFLHPGFRLAFTAPPGFRMTNGARAVSITGQGGQAEFSTAAYSGSLPAYIDTVLRQLAGDGNSGLPPGDVVRGTVNGFQTASRTVRANTSQGQVDITVIAYATAPDRAFHFTIITAPGQGLGPFGGMVQSLRPLTAAQAAAVKPRYLRVVTVRAGDTVQSLSQRMAFSDFQLDRFMTINGLEPGATVKPGDRVKIVTY
ncbi:M48 family metalloprotease [Sphingomonas sp.]|uniref:M48 family metalloprotease n=1 Tax=Sphingomonas sp. TaxID=28214 RepID=UPI001D25B2B0|nr:M48 family metalloprotease [Sphingomonas sp.]MBX9796806.1 M48 family metalloprotease [Sphingomonas sp.]